MKIVFFGTPRFAADLLKCLVETQRHEIVAVVARPDKPKGRGQKCEMTPVHEVASRLIPEVPFLQPEKASSPEVIETLRSLDADLFVVVAYGEIVTKALLAVPKICCVNVHASLLPLLRGAAPIQRAIMEGFSHTGITIMRMDAGMDTGDMIVKKEIVIGENDLFSDVEQKLEIAAQEALLEALDCFEKGTVQYTAQEHTQATKALKITDRDMLLDGACDVGVLHNTIRALSPKPGAYFPVRLREKACRLKVLKSKVLRQHVADVPCFQIFEGALMLSNPTGALVIEELQLEGKARMTSKEFLRGYPLPTL